MNRKPIKKNKRTKNVLYKGTDPKAYSFAGRMPTAKSRSLFYHLAKGWNFLFHSSKTRISPTKKTSASITPRIVRIKKSKRVKRPVKSTHTMVETPKSFSHTTKIVISEIGQKIGNLIIQSFFMTPEMASLSAIYKTVKIVVATKNFIVSLENFVENVSRTYEFFTYSGGGYYEIKDDMKSLLLTLQSGKEFVDSMKELCQAIGLVYEPFKMA